MHRSKAIGLIGGMSWESTILYYRLLNEGVKARLGGLHSARILLSSIDFAPMAELQAAGAWDEAGARLADEAAALERAGADFLLIGANTMHLVASAVTARVKIPLLHVVDPTGQAVVARGLRRVGLLGTRYTMEKAFYRERLESEHGVSSIIPPAADRDLVHRVIFEELCRGRIEPASREAYLRVAADLVAAGAEGIIYGCTEIGMLLGIDDVGVPAFDTTALHAAAAVSRALA